MLLPALPLVAGLGCGKGDGRPEVVVYAALDRVYSEPILTAFERECGIRAKPVFDVEAAKTIGLVNRIVAEKDRPMCDVFWNNEIAQTIRLAEAGLLDPYVSPQSVEIPPEFRDPKGLWTGFAARARAIIYNKEKIAGEEVPRSIRRWGKEARWRGRFAVANPRFGTTATQMAALLVLWGRQGVEDLWAGWRANGVAVLTGNATVKNDVGAGRYAFGLTDSDDVFGAMAEGMPVGLVFPEEGLLIPNSIALIHGAPHPEAAKRLIDYVLRAETEQLLAQSLSGQIPLRSGVPRPASVPAPGEVNSLPVDWQKVAAGAEQSAELMGTVFGEEDRK